MKSWTKIMIISLAILVGTVIAGCGNDDEGSNNAPTPVSQYNNFPFDGSYPNPGDFLLGNPNGQVQYGGQSYSFEEYYRRIQQYYRGNGYSSIPWGNFYGSPYYYGQVYDPYYGGSRNFGDFYGSLGGYGYPRGRYFYFNLQLNRGR